MKWLSYLIENVTGMVGNEKVRGMSSLPACTAAGAKTIAQIPSTNTNPTLFLISPFIALPLSYAWICSLLII